MAAPLWQAGKLYAPGDIVRPVTAPAPQPANVTNGNFADGDTGWDYEGLVIYDATYGYGDARSCVIPNGNGAGVALNKTKLYLPVGSQLTARAMIHQGASSRGQAAGWSLIRWFDAADAPIGADVLGNVVDDGSGGAWKPSSASSVMPAGAAYGRAGIGLRQSTVFPVYGDNLTVTGAVAGNPAGLVYKAVQPAIGTSGSSEPSWPAVLGQTVVDNEVIWEAVSTSRVTWEASPLYVTGPTEPDWPAEPGGFVPNGTISFEATDRRVLDPNCPNSKVVVIAKSKVYAGDKDVVRYSATLDATDWSTMEDAGYLGTGLQQNGANDVTVLNLYRGNLIVMNATTFQQWNIDPDPMLMDLLDVMEGIGSIWHLAAQPVANDLFYLSTLGVRTIGLSGQSNNLKAGDVGLPVDPMVQERVREAQAAGAQPLGMYYPASGQYWLIFNRVATDDATGVSACEVCPSLVPGDRYAEAMVYTLNQTGSVGAWTRFIFPFEIEYAAQEGDDLFVRDGDTVYRLNELIGACDFYDDGAQNGSPFDGVIWWPHLDMGRPGKDKTMEAFDLVGYGDAEIEVGYNQRDVLALTARYSVIADTLDGTPVPLTVTAPTLSYRLTYRGWQPANPATEQQRYWEFNALGVDIE